MTDRLQQYLMQEYDYHASEGNIQRELMLERAQLYGSLITIIKRENISNLVVSYDELVEAGKTLLVFTPSEDRSIVTITLKDADEDVTLKE